MAFELSGGLCGPVGTSLNGEPSAVAVVEEAGAEQ